MLRRTVRGRARRGARIEAAVEKVYATSDVRTPDLDGDATTEAFTAAVIAAL
jgi:isocitrate/isopropylmalate dehydrogenase